MTRAASQKTIELEYHLDKLPSSQHRAGLAGLVLMHRWLKRQPDRRGLCDLDVPDARSACLRMDRPGLESLLDQVYGARQIEREYPRPFKGKAPLREEERETTDPKTGKVKKKTVYIYPVVEPRGAYLESWDPTGDQGGVWIKLWRDMVWNILRGKPATRAPFEARATDKADKLAAGIWKDLGRKNAAVDLPSTYFLGAMAKTAENVSFRDLARYQFLLQFWPFVAQIYVPSILDSDGKLQFRGYALAVPDVADLEDFCEDLEDLMRARTGDVAGYVPRDAVVDIPAEAALDLMARLRRRAATGHDRHDGQLHGVDIFHMDKQGNNVPVLGTARVDLDPEMIDDYQRLRKAYRDHLFRRQRLVNLLAEAQDPHGRQKPWYAGFDRLLATTSIKSTIGSTWFCSDARKAFTGKNIEKPMNEKEKNIEELVYRVVNTYIRSKLKSKLESKSDSKLELKWDDVKDLPPNDRKRREYDEQCALRRDVARSAFLAARSRTGDDFVEYFTGSLCSVSQKLGAESYLVLSRALLDSNEIAKIRTLTLLALSACA